MSGMASTLETRLLQAQADAMAPIDLVSMLVSDELQCSSKRRQSVAISGGLPRSKQASG